ncbi:MAG: ABC transporter ATP-binding protein [Anaerolineales bacterium]|nr:ABC transporter ATP-binding protein [Anaerolineales bacterium]
MVTDPENFVELNSVTKQYPGAPESAVSHVSFSLRSGEVLALLGPNGAGKTTTVKMIAGLITPTSGVITIKGHDIVRERQKGIRHIGAVLEGARNLYWRLSAGENLRYFGSLRQVPRKQLPDRVDSLLSFVGLIDYKDREVGRFSRGMQQKLAIAAALLHDPDVLLLDEPTLGLDVQAARQLEESIAELAHKSGKAILLTTHVMDLAEKLADQIFVIHQGQMVVHAPTHTLLEQYDAQREVTELQVEGEINPAHVASLQEAFPGITVTSNDRLTHIVWPSIDQGKVILLMSLLNEYGATILNVGRRRARLEEVFLSLTEAEVVE